MVYEITRDQELIRVEGMHHLQDGVVCHGRNQRIAPAELKNARFPQTPPYYPEDNTGK